MPQEALRQVQALSEWRVVDPALPHAAGRGSVEVLSSVVESLPGWSYTPERLVPLPDRGPRMEGVK